MTARVDVAVIGGGIIGRSVATAAARRGMSVVVVEPGPPRFGSSSANAGHLVPSHVIPFASPGMVRAGLTSLLRRDGAFAVSRRAGGALVPYLVRFARSANGANVRRGVPVLRALLDLTMADIARLHDDGIDLDYDLSGLLQVCATQRSFDAARHEADHMRAEGISIDEWSAVELASAEPCLRGAVAGGFLLPGDARLDPARLLDAVTAEGSRLGVVTLDAEGRQLRVEGNTVVVETIAGTVNADQAVVAAGVWTPSLLRPLGYRLPILAAKGYSVTVTAPDPLLRRPLLLADQRLAVNPLAGGLRITGRYELTGPGDRFSRGHHHRRLVTRAGEVLPLDGVAPAEPWTGLRPATPDGLPVIGRLRSAPGVVVAAGHGMLGTTTGPGTGAVVAALLSGEPLPFDPAAVSPDRFV